MPEVIRFPAMSELGERIGPLIEQQINTFFQQLLAAPPGERGEGFLRIITGEPHPFGNFAMIADPSNAEATARAIEPLCSITQPAAALFCGLTHESTEQVLADAGFSLAESMPAMAVDINALAPVGLPVGYEFREVGIDEDDAWCAAFAEGYGVPRPVADLFGPANAEAHLPMNMPARYFAIANSTQFVATSLVLLEGGLAGVYGVSTVPEERGKGLAAYATAEPLRAVHATGYRIGILQSSAMGESVYRKLGFTPHGVVPLYVRMPEGNPHSH